MTRAGLQIRTAVPGDAAAIAHVKVASWRDTYAELVSAPVLAPLLDEARQTASIAAVLAGGGHLVLVAEREGEGEGEPLGFALCLLHPGAAPFLEGLHVLPRERGRGIGARLLRRLALELDARGQVALELHVVEGNTRARRFYERLGATATGSQAAAWAPDDSVEVRYRWDDLAPLRSPRR